jgi:nucleotide-binding universal stress UspA family protein
MKRILLATDGSSQAGKALETAAKLAQEFDAELVILHVMSHLVPLSSDWEVRVREHPRELAEQLASRPLGRSGRPSLSTDAADTERAGIARVMMSEQLLASSKALARRAGAKRVSTCLSAGNVAKAILATAKEKRADTIVLGSRGLGGLHSLILGSVSRKVSRNADCTVVTVR